MPPKARSKKSPTPPAAATIPEQFAAVVAKLPAGLKRVVDRELATGNPIADAGAVSVSGGIAELEVRDDVDSFVARAEAALTEAKHVRRGSVVVSGAGAGRPKANGTLHEIAPGDVVLEG